MGWLTDELPAPLADLRDGLDTLYDELRRMLGDGGLNFGGSLGGGASLDAAPAPTADDVTRVLHAVQQVIAGVRGIADAPDSAIPATLRADNFATEFPRQLVDYLVITYLQKFRPSLAFALRALGVVKVRYVAAAGNRPSHMRMALDLDELPTTLRDPSLVLRNAYGWGTPDLDFQTLSSQVDNLLSAIGVDTFMVEVPPEHAHALAGLDLDDPDLSTPRAVRAVIFERVRPTSRMSADVQLMELPGNGTDMPGLALLPGYDGLLNFGFALTEGLTVTIRSDLNLRGGVGLLIRPGKPIEVLVGFAAEDTSAPVSAKGSLEVRVDRADPTAA